MYFIISWSIKLHFNVSFCTYTINAYLMLWAVVSTMFWDINDAPQIYSFLYESLVIVAFQIVHIWGHVDWMSCSELSLRSFKLLRLPHSGWKEIGGVWVAWTSDALVLIKGLLKNLSFLQHTKPVAEHSDASCYKVD